MESLWSSQQAAVRHNQFSFLTHKPCTDMKRLEVGVVFVFGLVKPVQNYRQHTWNICEPFSSTFL